MTETTDRAWGAQSMTAPLLEVLVKAPGPAFGRAFDDPAVGFLRPVDLDAARREHDGLVETLTRLGTTVHVLDAETDDPDLVYVFDPMLIANGGAIPLRPGKPFYCVSCHEPHRSEQPRLNRVGQGMNSCSKCHKI